MPPICAEQEESKGTEIVVDAHQLLRWMPVRMKSFGSGATLAKGTTVVCDVRGHAETNNIGDLHRDSLQFVSSSNLKQSMSGLCEKRGPTKENGGLFELNDRTRTCNFPPNVTGPKRVLSRRRLSLRGKGRARETLSVFGT